LLRLNFHEHCPSGSENEFVDIDSFSDVASEIQKEVISAVATEGPAAAMDTAVPQSAHPQEEASSEFTRDLDLTIHKGNEPIQDVALLETREDLPEGQDPSPSVAAFNKSFGTSHHGELLSVSCEVARNKGGTPKVLTLWKSFVLIDEIGEGVRDNHFTCSEKLPAIPERNLALSYGPPWAHYLSGYQDRLLGGPLGLPDLRCTAPDGVKHKDYRGEVLG
jgi:hypothetical protein